MAKKKLPRLRASWAKVDIDPNNGKRKRLQIPEEEFYLQCSLMLGAPNRNARDFQQGEWQRGTAAYLRHTPDGRAFVELLLSHGEAKARAARWYYGYVRWWEYTVKRKAEPVEGRIEKAQAIVTMASLRNNHKRLRVLKLRNKRGKKKEVLVLGYATMYSMGGVAWYGIAEIPATQLTDDKYELVEVL